MGGVTDHAHHLDPLVLGGVGHAVGRAEGEALADRIVVRPVAAHELLVDHGHEARAVAVLVGQVAAAQQRDPQRLEELGLTIRMSPQGPGWFSGGW